MLIQFTVKNFRSFDKETTLSMVASPVKERRVENSFQVSKKLSLLKNAVIYGANASGKTNLFRAMGFMRSFVLSSSKETQICEPINISRFKLSTETEKEPAFFEIVFFHKKIRYRYGFAVTEEKIFSEWLYYVPNKQELQVFIRNEQNFELSRHFKSEEPLVKARRIRPNALFLSVSAQFNGEIARSMMEWFSGFNCISGIKSQEYGPVTLSLSEKKKGKKTVLEFLKRADLGIEDFNLVKTKIERDNLPPDLVALFNQKEQNGEIHQVDVKTVHNKYDSNGKACGVVYFDMINDESHGTQKFFELSGSIIDTLLNGKVLAVDELDSRLHPNLIREICELFNSKERNPHNAQLIFVSHNTNILDKDLLRRDQIWFVEKNQYGASELLSLVEFRDKKGGKKIRNDASYEKSYLKGIYGAVPCVRDLEVKYGDG